VLVDHNLDDAGVICLVRPLTIGLRRIAVGMKMIAMNCRLILQQHDQVVRLQRRAAPVNSPSQPEDLPLVVRIGGVDRALDGSSGI
jgi:hypothetical protein